MCLAAGHRLAGSSPCYVSGIRGWIEGWRGWGRAGGGVRIVAAPPAALNTYGGQGLSLGGRGGEQTLMALRVACSEPGRPCHSRRCRTSLWAPVAGARGQGRPRPFPAPQVRAFLQPPLRGVVMETFGCGNGPTKPDLLREFRAATERGLLIVNCTHCLQGTVTSGYAAGMVGTGMEGWRGRGWARGHRASGTPLPAHAPFPAGRGGSRHRLRL